MRAFKLQFNEHRLDPDFISLIDKHSADRLLYINILGSKRLRDCIQFQMTEEQRFNYISLQDNLLDAVEAIHSSHVAVHTSGDRQKNEDSLIQVMQSILELRTTLIRIEQAKNKATRPYANMIGPWPVVDMFFAINAVQAA